MAKPLTPPGCLIDAGNGCELSFRVTDCRDHPFFDMTEE